MHRLVSALRTPLALCIGVVAVACIFAAAIPGASTSAAQPTATHTRIADDADVLGAERLFSAWMEGQIAYRGLPGIAVGVVSDQELVWSKGFGRSEERRVGKECRSRWS